MDAKDREREPHRVGMALIDCPARGKAVDLRQPFPTAAWHVVHTCVGGAIEVVARSAGERPWVWRLSKFGASQAD